MLPTRSISKVSIYGRFAFEEYHRYEIGNVGRRPPVGSFNRSYSVQCYGDFLCFQITKEIRGHDAHVHHQHDPGRSPSYW